MNKGRKKGRAATPDLPNSLRKIRILHEYYRRGAEDTDFSPWLLYCATVFREVGSLLLWSAAMEGTVGRRGCKPGVAIGCELPAMLDMAFRGAEDKCVVQHRVLYDTDFPDDA